MLLHEKCFFSSLSERDRSRILERYIGRYIEHISTATTGHRTGETGGTGQDVASEILSVGPIQQEDLVKNYNFCKGAFINDVT